MKITILHSGAVHELARGLYELIVSHGCKAEVMPIESTWDGPHAMNPTHLFKGSSHLLFLHDADPFMHAAFLFYSGYCIGKGLRIIILEAEKGIAQKKDGYIGTILQPETFEGFLQSEIVRYDTEDKMARAKAELMERGISCFAENFVSMVISGDEDNASLFLKAGFSPRITDVYGTPLLSLAVREQIPDMVRLLLSAGADVNALSADRSYTPLMDAAQKGDHNMCKILLEAGANPDVKSKDGQTALVLATGRGDVELCKLLISCGADPSVPDNLGLSAAGYARLFKNDVLIELFNAGSI